jgi:cytochrome b561
MTDLPKEAPKASTFDLFGWGIYTLQLAEPISPRTLYFNLHKSIGVTVFALIIVRVLWRFTHQPPALLSSLKDWERKLAKAGHHLLYLLMIAVPVTGLIMASYSKYGVKWFGMLVISGHGDDAMRKIYEQAHEIVGIVLLVVVVLHILGALKHKFIDKDETLKRMSLH